MAIIKCKMCGGDLEVASGVTVAECEFCGTKQTLPKNNEEVIQNLFNRANALRLKCEFDKAEQIYEKILQNNDAESEAHWGIVLCKYGIEYVEDPVTYKRIPTCHRTSYDAVTTDADYLAAIEYADAVQRSVYEAEAKAIDEIQKNILNIVKDEKPFDVFICYKETDENGKRTIDSALANDIYHQLTQEGLKVFYAAITLEDKLGQEYEPYIFAALNSAKVMLVIGTKPQYFSAVWVKNEWSRFLKLMKIDRSKLLIPCFKDMDAYELPEEFAHLQAQDMGKIGFINDIVRGIKKVTIQDAPKESAAKETAVPAGNATVAPLLKRVFMFLEDGDWKSADEYCEKVLDIDPECAEAYLGKLMAERHARKQSELKECTHPFFNSGNYQKAIRFADKELRTALESYIEHIETRNENARLKGIYEQAQTIMTTATNQGQFKEAAELFASISAYKDSEELVKTCEEKAEIARKDEALEFGKNKMKANNENAYSIAITYFKSISGWKDADELIVICQEKIAEIIAKRESDRKDRIYSDGVVLMSSRIKRISDLEKAIAEFEKILDWKDSAEKIEHCKRSIGEIKAQEEADRIERERQAEIARIEAERLKKRNKKIAVILAAAACVITAFIILFTTVILPNIRYNRAVSLMEEENYYEAYRALVALGDYKDSAEKADFIYKNKPIAMLQNASIGDSVSFGKYEQDNDISNGSENIDWIVLDIKDGKVLLISKYALDCRPYHTDKLAITWEDSALRTWLNGEFADVAFSDEQKAMILTENVPAGKNSYHYTNPGNATQDQVFVLSEAETKKYFNTDSLRQCTATAYAHANGVDVNADGKCFWWNRTPGAYANRVSLVIASGYNNIFGEHATAKYVGVRPAMWVDIS